MDVCNRGGNTLNKKLSYVLVNLESVYGVYVKMMTFYPCYGSSMYLIGLTPGFGRLLSSTS